MQWLDLPDDLGPNLGSYLQHLHLDLVFTYIYIIQIYPYLMQWLDLPDDLGPNLGSYLQHLHLDLVFTYIYIYI